MRLEPSGWIRLYDVLRQGPAEHRGANLPALFRFPPFSLVGHGIQDLADVPPADIRGVSLKDWCERAPQTALDRLRGPQTAENPPAKIEIDQRLNRDPRTGCVTRLVLVGD
jgi:hypothetical protein